MPHLGLLCPTATGHLNPMGSLGRALQRRGHRVTMFQLPEAEPKVRAAGLDFVALGEGDFPPGTLAGYYETLGRLKGFAALRWTIEIMRRRAEAVIRDAPAALRAAGVDALVIDQASMEGSTVAGAAGLPFAGVANALPLNREPGLPPFHSGWSYRDAAWARLRNRLAYALQDRASRPLRETINGHRRRLDLPQVTEDGGWFSPLVQVAQIPLEFEFPSIRRPAWLHYTGPFFEPDAREPVPFPYDRLDGRPLIYASMGTLQNRLGGVFESIARACEGLDAQLVLSLGGSADPRAFAGLPGAPIVVGYAPQLDLVARARLVITHAGLNTTTETLSQGVPMVAIPVDNDQPGVAARLARSGAGMVVPLARLTAPRLRAAVVRVLGDSAYDEAAARLRDAIRRAGGAPRAAELIERALTTLRPVLFDRASPGMELPATAGVPA